MVHGFPKDCESQNRFQDSLLEGKRDDRRPIFHGGLEKQFDLFLQSPVFSPQTMIHSRPFEETEKILGHILFAGKR